MRNLSQKKWFSGILALLFALLLFFNANAQGTIPSNLGSNQIYDEMIYNVPVQLEYDKDKYFVSGYEETVNVQLSSANRVQLNKEVNEDTRSLQVVADLTNVPVGTSEIQLKVKGLSSAVNASMEPQTITATIEKKVSKTFKVEAQLPDSFESEGYKANKITVDPQEVKITTGEETLKAIDRVIAPLSNVKQSVDTIKQTVNVQAVDKNGQILTIENPAPQVSVTVDLTVPSKEVSLRAVSSGDIPSGVNSFSFILSNSKVEIRGPNSVLSAIDVLDVPVDVTDVRATTKQTVTIPTSEEYEVTPSDVDVTITPLFADSLSNSYYEGSSSSSFSSSNPGTTSTFSSETVEQTISSNSSTTVQSSPEETEEQIIESVKDE